MKLPSRTFGIEPTPKFVPKMKSVVSSAKAFVIVG
jgi:hypothetical protein